ncbi:uncharacterized protein LOC118184310 [Stegodyphus dumicola]|uniref:uncharacterized protein LOC118184310 n=1 Tax=Stegodyphus dumicola TaxID=202533 RepID=UPI0015ABCD47|nr:uncharacterized protein LOC118184310 [Stegodyphus dumicola]
MDLRKKIVERFKSVWRPKGRAVISKNICLACFDKGPRPLFRFPNNRTRIPLWLRAIDREDLLECDPNYIYYNARLCDAHFADWAFTSSERVKLISYAMPCQEQPPSDSLENSNSNLVPKIASRVVPETFTTSTNIPIQSENNHVTVNADNVILKATQIPKYKDLFTCADEMKLLIKQVKNHPVLYVPYHVDYKKGYVKDTIWNEIARRLKYANGNEAEVQWNYLTNCYRFALEVRNKKRPKKNISIWSGYKEMEFLLPFMDICPMITSSQLNGDEYVSNTESESELLIQESSDEESVRVSGSGNSEDHNQSSSSEIVIAECTIYNKQPSDLLDSRNIKLVACKEMKSPSNCNITDETELISNCTIDFSGDNMDVRDQNDETSLVLIVDDCSVDIQDENDETSLGIVDESSIDVQDENDETSLEVATDECSVYDNFSSKMTSLKKTKVNASSRKRPLDHDKICSERDLKSRKTIDGDEQIQKQDGLYQFFMSVYSTTKSLPRVSQQKIQKKVLEIVLRAEEQLESDVCVSTTS